MIVTDPCFNYFLLNGVWRDVTGYNVNSNSGSDYGKVEGWYRFQLNTINAAMVTYAPSINRCGTTGPIWWNGK